jgi:hypothetical protein
VAGSPHTCITQRGCTQSQDNFRLSKPTSTRVTAGLLITAMLNLSGMALPQHDIAMCHSYVTRPLLLHTQCLQHLCCFHTLSIYDVWTAFNDIISEGGFQIRRVLWPSPLGGLALDVHR